MTSSLDQSKSLTVIATRLRYPLLLTLAGLLCGSVTGCSSLNIRGGQIKELQSENQRLMTEYRAEKTRREQAELALKQMENRLAQSEKLVARRYGPTAPRTPSNTPYNFGSSNSGTGTLNGLGESFGRGYGSPDDAGMRWQSRVGR
ncbi:MAG: hypothetical protein VXZ82_22720 [Planctomycetota bacterium]|nr:hypothetical protein [Planctomycetota bacterium]